MEYKGFILKCFNDHDHELSRIGANFDALFAQNALLAKNKAGGKGKQKLDFTRSEWSTRMMRFKSKGPALSLKESAKPKIPEHYAKTPLHLVDSKNIDIVTMARQQNGWEGGLTLEQAKTRLKRMIEENNLGIQIVTKAVDLFTSQVTIDPPEKTEMWEVFGLTKHQWGFIQQKLEENLGVIPALSSQIVWNTLVEWREVLKESMPNLEEEKRNKRIAGDFVSWLNLCKDNGVDKSLIKSVT